ncbi:MAG: PQQ-binding-like beta-propeller repeat protein [Actinomycetota bacterium]|nr:PQQ-binding-like beta-propeller repeat protein [Actinomycetota bacterium]
MPSSPVWRAYLPAGTSSPVVTARGVFVTSDYRVDALDRTSGNSVWTATINSGYPPDELSTGAPIVRDDTNEVLLGTTLSLGPGVSDRSFLSFDTRTGVKQGEAAAVGVSASLRGARLADTGLVSLPHNQGTFPEVEVRNRDDGTSWGGYTMADGTPTLGTSSLYVAGDTKVSSYDTGVPCSPVCSPTWSVTLDGRVQPVVIGEDRSVLYVGTTAGTLYAVDAATGATKWKTSVGSAITGSPALSNGVLYIPTSSGSLAALPAAECRSATCSVIWTGATPASISAQPAVAGGVVYAGSSDGAVTAFDAAGCKSATCRPVWAGRATGSSAATPVNGLAVAFGSLYVGVNDGVAAFR